MELKEEEESEPVSPTAQYLSSSTLSLCILAILEFEQVLDDSLLMQLVKDVFLSISPRFSSVRDENGAKQRKRVEVKLINHVKFPFCPSGLSPESYDKYLGDYISEIGMQQLPQSQPLWEIHLIRSPTSHAACTLIFKLHHSLGDGFSLMGALLSCLQRADDPSLPLTLPSVFLPSTAKDESNGSIFTRVLKIFSTVSDTVLDFCWNFVKSTTAEDDQTPIRSGDDRVEFRPVRVATMTFSLDHVKQIKTKVVATINDVVTGIIFLGTRLYMQELRHDSSNAKSTALILLNTRVFRSYESVKDMLKHDANAPWGNYFAFLHMSIPELTDDWSSNPLDFVVKARQIMNFKKNSLAVYLTARYIHSTLKNTSMGMTNLIGPVEKMALANHPVKGLYFAVVGAPQSLSVTIISYMEKLRVSVVAEDGFIDSQKLKSCVEHAFEVTIHIMDKTWIFCDRLSDVYSDGVDDFLEFAILNSENRMSIRCPCTSCVLLEVFNEILPNDNSLPKSMYKAKKTMKLLGLDYEKIHACRNDCILYRNEFKNLSECPRCGASRLKRMFQSPQTVENLKWHENKRIRNGKLHHPADSPAWQLIDKKWPDFSQEPRNLRLALSSNGINSHSTLSTTYSYWPVTLITYNLPPWLCMKRKFMMLSLLISGPKQPGNDIDVYLVPLIADLKTLWDVGVDVFDAYRKQTFNLRAVLMWTISDFLAYGNLFGCTVKESMVVQFVG
ncbi:diacylglycerol O-acyltransferase [Citrus sinensis]|uniref:Diacylglycerol O-acyltransferase n=1 Tax=Citrus sinensis TaxID=2711 RepID=A0ACB8N4Z2_CITSI|nr:diacylglycerol O-acyltransferase [Citrus sinensis]